MAKKGYTYTKKHVDERINASSISQTEMTERKLPVLPGITNGTHKIWAGMSFNLLMSGDEQIPVWNKNSESKDIDHFERVLYSLEFNRSASDVACGGKVPYAKIIDHETGVWFGILTVGWREVRKNGKTGVKYDARYIHLQDNKIPEFFGNKTPVGPIRPMNHIAARFFRALTTGQYLESDDFKTVTESEE